MRWRKVRYVAFLGIVGWSTSYAAFAAASQPAVLVYDAPPECPREESVVERTSALIRYRPFAPIFAKATITRQASGYRLELDLDGGQQHVLSESCDSLVQTLAVILALAIDVQGKEPPASQSGQHPLPAAAPAPSSSATLPPLPRGPQVTAPMPHASVTLPPNHPPAASIFRRNPVVTVPARDSLEAPRHQSRLNPELHLSTQLMTEFGMLRRLAEGPSLGLRLDVARWSLAATAEWILPQWKQMPNSTENKGGHISFLGGQIGPCLAVTQARLIHACAGVEAGDIMGKGSGVSNARLGHGIWLAGAAGLGLVSRISSNISADLRLGVAIPVKRPAFGFDDYSWRFEPFPWSLRLLSGFSWF